MKKHTLKFIVVLGVLAAGAAISGCGKKDVSTADRAAVLEESARQSTNLADLLAHHSSHVTSPQPWVGYWFPYTAGGIAGAASKYETAYLNGARAEGRDTSNFKSAVSWELYNHGAGVPKIEPWFGHCNGWTASSIMVPEPQGPKVVDGVEFSIGDQKAILAESWLEFSGDFVGTRVNDKGDFSSAAFWDVVPAQFTLMLTNVAGKFNKGIIIDRHTGYEIWNQPLTAYQIDPVRPEDYLGPHPSAPDIYRVNMTARIWWANDNVGPDQTSPVFDINAMHDNYYDALYPGRILHYEIWLDAPPEFDATGNLVKSGNILVTQENGRYLGGIWKNGSSPEGLINSHPDYMWVPFGRAGSTGYKNPNIDDNWVREKIAGAWIDSR